MRIKVSKATNLQLDWLVAKCEGMDEEMLNTFEDGDWLYCARRYSTNWNQGGPIIERERISIRQWVNVSTVHAYMPDGEWSSDDSSPLVASMRCFVARKLGNEVEVPDELA